MGAFDDDDDLERRDHGPRPEVPNHGARPVLIGIPILLITIAAIIAIVVAGGRDDEPTPAGTPGAVNPAAGSSDASTEQVVAAVRANADQLAGRADPSAFADTTCEPTDGGAGSAMGFDCAFGGEGDPDSGTIRVRLQTDGTVTKVLGTAPTAEGQKTSTQTQELLANDDAASGASKVSYTCATSTPINPDGTAAGSTATGQRCVLLKGSEVMGQRYVEFAADGTARRDFMLQPE